MPGRFAQRQNAFCVWPPLSQPLLILSGLLAIRGGKFWKHASAAVSSPVLLSVLPPQSTGDASQAAFGNGLADTLNSRLGEAAGEAVCHFARNRRARRLPTVLSMRVRVSRKPARRPSRRVRALPPPTPALGGPSWRKANTKRPRINLVDGPLDISPEQLRDTSNFDSLRENPRFLGLIQSSQKK